MPRGVPGTHDLGHDKLLEPEDVPLVGLHLEGLAAQDVRELLHTVDDGACCWESVIPALVVIWTHS